MTLDEGDADAGQRVPDRDRRMRVRPRVDDDAIDRVQLAHRSRIRSLPAFQIGVEGLVDAVDQGALVVRLEGQQRHAAGRGEGGQVRLDVVEGGVAVDPRFAVPEQVQVGPVQEQDGFLGGAGLGGR